MKSDFISHSSFTIERTYNAPASRVFSAWKDPELKARWFKGPETWTQVKRELDFSVGGHELLQGRFVDGGETFFSARYYDIIPNNRIVYVYDMHINDRLHSVSLATVEITPSGDKTHLLFTEQVAFMDGTNGIEGAKSRKHGTAAHFDRLEQYFAANE
jgi:uncharacterized protein YndB with AHSA1/START domain